MIKLTGSNGEPVWVNIRHIEFFRRSESHTLIRMVSGSDLYVTEKVNEIAEQCPPAVTV